LRIFQVLFYAVAKFWGSVLPENMQRVIARFLLGLALAGTFLPAAMQALAAPPHACCLRKAAHSCHKSAGDQQRSVHGPGCCDGNCYRAVTTSHWAHPQPSQQTVSLENLSQRGIDSQPVRCLKDAASTQSTRAPPAC